KASACKADHRECNSPRHLQDVLRWCSSVGRARASEVRDRRSNRRASSAGIAQWEEQAHGKRPTAVRGCVPAPKVLLLWPTYKGACLVSRVMLVGIQPAAPNSMAGLAEWLRRWIVTPVTRVRFSHLAQTGRFV